MANTGYYSTTTTDDNGYTLSEAAGTSLCPTGWKLPYGRDTGKGATTGGFSYLDAQMGGTGAPSTTSTDPTGATMSIRWRSFPNNFVYSGYFNNSSAGGRSNYGDYWSSSATSNNYAYTFYFLSTIVYPGPSDSNKYAARTVRCLLASTP